IQVWPKDLLIRRRQPRRSASEGARDALVRLTGLAGPSPVFDRTAAAGGAAESLMFDQRRREFLALVGGATAAGGLCPRAARAQQPALPVVGYVHPASPAGSGYLAAAFRKGLMEAGYIENRNVAIEYRWAEGRYDRLPALVDDLVRRQVSVIVAVGGDPPVVAAKAATSTIPIVFHSGSGPVQLGLVASLNRPGGNITGAVQLTGALGLKQLELLRELVPAAEVIGMLANSTNPSTETRWMELQTAARTLGQDV